jgi:hypothetical protein
MTSDYCDTCGDPIAPDRDERCPVCATPRSGNDRYCEQDGYDFVTHVGPAGTRAWTAIVTADRNYYERVAAVGVEFPTDPPQRTFVIRGHEVLVGRRSDSRGISPEIDLAGAPEDLGISHVHARLVRGSDDVYALVDLDSTNGTTMNGDPTPLPPNTPVTVTDGDRIHVGAWTTITLRWLAGPD